MNEDRLDDIAVIGMNCRFPKAGDITTFWERIRDGDNCISYFSDEELLSRGVDQSLFDDPSYVKAGGVCDRWDHFDPEFFGFSPREAEMLDPQIRILLECAWAVVEDAGYRVDTYDKPIGIFCSTSVSRYLIQNLMRSRSFLGVDSLELKLTNEKDFLSTQIAFRLNLRGPALTIQTACSSSLVAVNIACQNLLNYQCDMAMAGGVSINPDIHSGYMHSLSGVSSKDGHTRSYDERATGATSGNGAGIVLLKRYEDAVTDGDCISAIIRGSAVNNDGALKVGFTAPSVGGQAAVIRRAYDLANVDPGTVSLIEGHGSATPLGDPIEVAALKQIFTKEVCGKHTCALGSVKSNVGHLDAAAGIAGFMKAVLALKHRKLPPVVDFENLNPEIELGDSALYISDRLRDWERGTAPRRAGVSSFGMGGVNAHVILEEAPERAEGSVSERRCHLVTFSARKETEYEKWKSNLSSALRGDGCGNLSDVAYTLNQGRKPMSHRGVFVCRDSQDAIEALEGKGRVLSSVLPQKQSTRLAAFLFPGLGDYKPGLSADLYKTERVYRESVDECLQLLEGFMGYGLKEMMFGETLKSEELRPWNKNTAKSDSMDLRKMLAGPDEGELSSDPVRSTKNAQPILFVLEYSLAKLFMSWGIRPRCMLGYSLGEYVAATVSGVFSLESALRLVSRRAVLIDDLEIGSMLAIPLPKERVEELLPSSLSISAINGRNMTVVGGSVQDVEAFSVALKEQSIVSKLLQTTHAFHTNMMLPAVEALRKELRSLRLKIPEIPFISNTTGDWIKAEEATSVDYWVNHMLNPVNFDGSARVLLNEESYVLVEMGPGQALSTLLKQHERFEGKNAIVSCLNNAYTDLPDDVSVVTALGGLWLAGIDIDWNAYYADEQRLRVPLPTYPFDGERYIVEPDIELWDAGGGGKAKGGRSKVEKWFYAPSWEQAPVLERTRENSIKQVMIFADEAGVGEEIGRNLENMGVSVCYIFKGDSFKEISDNHFRLRSGDADDFNLLAEEAKDLDFELEMCLYFWPLDIVGEATKVFPGTEEYDCCFFNLMYLVQSFAKNSVSSGIELWMFADGWRSITKDDLPIPSLALMSGPYKVIKNELPLVRCASVDFRVKDFLSVELLAEALMDELLAGIPVEPVAYRGGMRWRLMVRKSGAPSAWEKRSIVREGGSYLITDGLSERGLSVAESLIQEHGVNVLLVSPLNLAEDAESVQSTGGNEKELALRALKLADQGRLIIEKASVANKLGLDAAVSKATSKWGSIDGVFHMEEELSEGILLLKTPADTRKIFEPKILGLENLEYALRKSSPDFMILYSSILSIIGGAGQIDYCSANAYMDSYANRKNGSGNCRFLSINWGLWGDEGLDQKEDETPIDLFRREYGVRSEDSVDALKLLLGRELFSQIVALPIELKELDEVIEYLVLDSTGGGGSERHPRPELNVDFEAPQGEIEESLAHIWAELFGIETIGRHDDFYDLNGNSLLAIQCVYRIQAKHKVDLDLVIIFQKPTIAQLAEEISLRKEEEKELSALLDSIEGMSDEEVAAILEEDPKAREARKSGN